MPPTNNNVSFSFSGDASELLNTIQQLNQAVQQLKSNAGSVNFRSSGGTPGGAGTYNFRYAGPGTASGAAASSASVAAGMNPPVGGAGRMPNTTPAMSASMFTMPSGASWGGGGTGGGGYALGAPAPGGPGSVSQGNSRLYAPLRGAADATFDRVGMRMLEAGALSAAIAGSDLISQQTRAILTGRADVMGIGRAVGEGIGGILGGALGSMLPFPGAMIIGVGVGSRLFGQAAEFATAPVQNYISTLDTARTITETAGPMSRTSPFARYMRLGALADIASGPLGRLHLNPLGVSASEVANGYASVSGGLIAGGLNPFERVGDQVYGLDTARSLRRWIRETMGTGAAAQAFSRAATSVLVSMGAGREERAEQITRRAYNLYKNRGTDVLQELTPTFASLPETGGNLADILMAQGPLKTGMWERLQNDAGTMEVPLDRLMGVNAGVRGAERTARIASTGARGVGASTMKAFQSQMDSLSLLPEGRDSLAYAQANERRRDARLQSYTEENTVRFDIPMTGLAGARERANVEPYSPGRIFALDMQMMASNMGKMSALQGQMRSLKRSGDLSERSELAYNQQIQGLATSNARMRSEIGADMANRLPALMAGGGASYNRFDSAQQAAMAVPTMAGHIRPQAAPASSGQDGAELQAVLRLLDRIERGLNANSAGPDRINNAFGLDRPGKGRRFWE